MPVRLLMNIPTSGLGKRYDEMLRWLEARCGRDGYVWVPSGIHGLNATFLYFWEVGVAKEFAERWPLGDAVPQT